MATAESETSTGRKTPDGKSSGGTTPGGTNPGGQIPDRTIPDGTIQAGNPPDPATSRELTRVLSRWNDGDEKAAASLLPMVYDELRRLARGHLRKERADHTLQPTALVHEAYMRLADRINARWNDRVHFYAVAAKVMRQILVDHARRHSAMKRGGEAAKVSLEGLEIADASAHASRLLVLDEALDRLRTMDARKAQVIELRYFGGLTIDECAAVLGVSTPTVVGDARKARAWLYKELGAGGDVGDAG